MTTEVKALQNVVKILTTKLDKISKLYSTQLRNIKKLELVIRNQKREIQQLKQQEAQLKDKLAKTNRELEKWFGGQQ